MMGLRSNSLNDLKTDLNGNRLTPTKPCVRLGNTLKETSMIIALYASVLLGIAAVVALSTYLDNRDRRNAMLEADKPLRYTPRYPEEQGRFQ